MKQVQTPKGHTLKIGDVFYRSWGYEQTNINFIKIVGFTPSGKSAKVVAIGQTVVKQHEFMSEDVAPDTNNVLGKEKNFLIGDSRNYQEADATKPILKGNGDWYSQYEHPLYQSHYA